MVAVFTFISFLSFLLSFIFLSMSTRVTQALVKASTCSIIRKLENGMIRRVKPWAVSDVSRWTATIRYESNLWCYGIAWRHLEVASPLTTSFQFPLRTPILSSSDSISNWMWETFSSSSFFIRLLACGHKMNTILWKMDANSGRRDVRKVLYSIAVARTYTMISNLCQVVV